MVIKNEIYFLVKASQQMIYQITTIGILICFPSIIKPIVSNIVVNPVVETLTLFIKPIRVIWGFLIISTSIFIGGGTILHYFYN